MANYTESEATASEPTPKVRRMSVEEVQIIEDPPLEVDDQKVPPNEVIPAAIPSTSRQNTDFETIFRLYLTTFRDRMTALKAKETEINEKSDDLNKIYIKVKNNNEIFLRGSQFGKLMKVFTKEISEMASVETVVRHHSDLAKELNRFTQKTVKKKVKNKNEKVKELTDTLKRLQRQIRRAENEELDMDQLDNVSIYTDLPKLYRRIYEVWIKREELLNRSTNTGRVLFQKFTFDSTPHPEINECVEVLFNKHMKRIKKLKKTKPLGYIDESFTFIDVRKAVLDVINDKQLAVMNTEAMIEKIWEELMDVKQKRRQKDNQEVYETLEMLDELKPDSIADEDDPSLEIEFSKNKKHFETKMEELFEKYVKEDKTKNGESILKEGTSEWDLTTDNTTENNGEFESLDVKDGELEEEDESEDEESDDEVQTLDTSIPEFSTNGESTAAVSASETSETPTIDTSVTTSTTDTVVSVVPSIEDLTAPVITNLNNNIEVKPAVISTTANTTTTAAITAQTAATVFKPTIIMDTITIDDDDSDVYEDDDDVVILD